MKSIKIYANVAGAVTVNIHNQNAYTGRPYIQISDKDNTVLTFYSQEDYTAYLEYRKEQN